MPSMESILPASTVSEINRLLNSSGTRLDGLNTLELSLNYFSLDVLNDNASQWIVQLLRIMRAGDYGFQKAAKALGNLLEISASSSELSRDLSSAIPQVINVLGNPKQKEENLPASFDCLATVLKNFRGPVFPFKNAMEDLLLSYFDLVDLIAVSSLAKCYAQLPQIGGSGIKGLSHKQAWSEQSDKVILSLKSTLKSFLGETVSEEGLNLPKMTAVDPITDMHRMAVRYRNLCMVLSRMLSDPFPAPKCIPVASILSLSNEVFCLSPLALSKRIGGNTSEGKERQKLFPDLQVVMLQLLNNLIKSCRKQLLPHGRSICSFALQVLQWSHTPLELREVGRDRPHRKLRSAAYNTLAHWVNASNTGSRIEKFAIDLSKEIFSDIVTDRDVVALQKVEISAKKKRGSLSYDTVKPIDHHIDRLANAEVCNAALTLLGRILRSLSSIITLEFYQMAQKIILPIVIELEAGIEESPIPYSDSAVCRKSIYKVLEALVVCPHSSGYPPYSYAISAFSCGQNDPDLEVSSTCFDALKSCEAIIHPVTVPVGFAMKPPVNENITSESMVESSISKLWKTVEEDITRKSTVEPSKITDVNGRASASIYVQSHSEERVTSIVDEKMEDDDQDRMDSVSNISTSPEHNNFDSDVDIADTPLMKEVVDCQTLLHLHYPQQLRMYGQYYGRAQENR
ncbi:hypothetical protein QYM36_006612 [Artemia franciscana]|uniref:Pre-rRNA-processing protein RIX1 N-terminal domain-containing protein n=1 Tax=Artemia franciscana TaxID=6661 RepID=A0AA88IAQ7_ARTSF|nr:hypothetical protein QYM36_006612 [Artemia franciscana]